jgi:hypothetical protein
MDHEPLYTMATDRREPVSTNSNELATAIGLYLLVTSVGQLACSGDRGHFFEGFGNDSLGVSVVAVRTAGPHR